MLNIEIHAFRIWKEVWKELWKDLWKKVSDLEQDPLQFIYSPSTVAAILILRLQKIKGETMDFDFSKLMNLEIF